MNIAEYESEKIGLSVLIVAYRRWKNVGLILESCQKAGIKDIYITIDAPKDNARGALEDHHALIKVISDFEVRVGQTLRKRVNPKNQGCAVTVIQGCDWAFETSEYLIVLEDDCLPSSKFFDFCVAELSFVKNLANCWLLCGSQFAPMGISKNQVSLSRYALTWGWATHKIKWIEMRKVFFYPPKFPEARDLLSLDCEKSFWNAGSRRAYRGFTDVWDTILLQKMQQENRFAILPQENLVENVGNDEVSTHTKPNSPWVAQKNAISESLRFDSPELNAELDQWLSKEFYRIRLRHLFSTKLTLLLDILFHDFRKKFDLQLHERL